MPEGFSRGERLSAAARRRRMIDEMSCRFGAEHGLAAGSPCWHRPRSAWVSRPADNQHYRRCRSCGRSEWHGPDARSSPPAGGFASTPFLDGATHGRPVESSDDNGQRCGCGDLTDGRHRLRLDSFASAEAGLAQRELARLALWAVTRNPIDLYKRPSGTRKIGPASSRWGIYDLLRDRKIATGLRRDGAESLGFYGTGCGRRQHSAPTKKILNCFP